MGQNVNPAQPAAPAKDALSLGATDATTLALKTLAEHIGAAAAYSRMQRQNAGDGTIMGGGAQVQAPSPAILPPMATQPDVPLIGGGYPDKERQDKADMTNLFNTVKHGLDSYTAKKNQETAVKAARDYDSLMKAYQINQSLQAQLKDKPNDPNLKAMIDQNNNVINGFFDDEKKRKRLEKVMGIEMESKAAATQGGDPKLKAKQSDPDYAGFKMAQKGELDKAQATMPGPDGGTLPQVTETPGGGTKMGAEVLGMPSNIKPPWLSGLNDRAANFFGRQPVAPGTMEYVPGPKDLALKWQIGNKLVGDGNSHNDLLKTMYEWDIRGLGDIFKGLNDRDIEEAKLQYKKYGDDLDAGTKWNISLANIGMDKQKLALDAWYKNNELLLKDKELRLKTPEVAMKIYDAGVEIADKNFKLSQEAYIAAQDAAKAAKTMGNTKTQTLVDNSKLIEAGYQKMLEAHQKLQQVTKDRENYIGELGISTSPSGAGTGQSVINQLKTGTPSPTNNGGANPAATAGSGGASSGQPITPAQLNNYLPTIGFGSNK